MIPTTPSPRQRPVGASPAQLQPRRGKISRGVAWAAAVAGYVLSPLSWWNDLFVNVPLAYLFAWPFSQLHRNLYLPAFVLGYWLSNLAGLWLLHYAGTTLIRKRQPGRRAHILLFTAIYTVLIVVLVLLGVLPSAGELMRH